MTEQEPLPRTLHEAVGLVLGSLTDEERQRLRDNPEWENLLHHSLGRNLRNTWKLWQSECELPTWFRTELRIWHADDMSGLIMYGVGCFVRGQLPDYAKQAERYHTHWRRYGLDPYTGAEP